MEEAAGPPRSIWAQLDTLQAPRQRTGEPGRYVVEASWDGISGTETTTEAKISSDPEEEGMEECLLRQQLLLQAHPSAHTVLLRVLRVDGEPGPGAALVGELRLDAANLGAAGWHALAGVSGGSDGRIRLCLVAPVTGPGTDEEHAAATRIQARLRGKKARKTVMLMKGLADDLEQTLRTSSIWAQLDKLQAPRQRTNEPGRYVVEISWDGISGTERTTEAKVSFDQEDGGMEECLVRQQLLLRAHPSAHTVLLRVLRVDGEPGPGAALVGELRLDAANLGAADWHALAGGSGGSDGRIRLCLVAPRTGPGTDEEHAAATRIQARLRGKQARKTVLLMKGIPADPAQAPRSSARAPTRGADGHDERAAPDPARALRGSAAQAPAQDLDEDDTPQASTRTPAHAASDPARASRGSARAPSGAGVRFGPDSGGEAAAGASTRPRAEAASGPARAGRSSARHTRLEGVDDGDAEARAQTIGSCWTSSVHGVDDQEEGLRSSLLAEGAEGGAFEQMLADLFQELDEARAGRLGVDAMFELRVLRGGPEDWETFQRAWGSACEAEGWPRAGPDLEQFREHLGGGRLGAQELVTIRGAVGKSSRRDLIEMIFSHLDSDNAGSLSADEMYDFVVMAGARESKESFLPSYAGACQRYSWDPSRGPDVNEFVGFLSDQEGPGYRNMGELRRVMNMFRRQQQRWMQAHHHPVQALSDMRQQAQPDCMYAGWLQKRGPMAGYAWVRRYCRLQRGLLEYFEDGSCEVKKGDIAFGPRTAACEMRAASAPGEAVKYRTDRPFGFVLDIAPEAGKQRHLYYFDAAVGTDDSESEGNLQAWIRHIGAAGHSRECLTNDTGEFHYLVLQDCAVYMEAQRTDSMKFDKQLATGSLQKVVRRAQVDDTMWFELSDNSGWVTEMAGGKRQLSEVVEEPLADDADVQAQVIQPKLKNPIALRPFAGSRGGGNDAPRLHAGTTIQILAHAKILMPRAKTRTEEWKRFLCVRGEGGEQGWIAYHSPSMEENVTKCQVFATASDGQPGLASILAGDADVTMWMTPGRSSPSGKTLRPGDLVQIKRKLTTSGLNFFELACGFWVCETDDRGRLAVDVVERRTEEAWVYFCQDKGGAEIRKLPTHQAGLGTGYSLKHRERCVAAEKVIFTNGDTFLKIQPPAHEGWVPLNNQDGTSKMKALQRAPADGKRPPGGAAGPQLARQPPQPMGSRPVRPAVPAAGMMTFMVQPNGLPTGPQMASAGGYGPPGGSVAFGGGGGGPPVATLGAAWQQAAPGGGSAWTPTAGAGPPPSGWASTGPLGPPGGAPASRGACPRAAGHHRGPLEVFDYAGGELPGVAGPAPAAHEVRFADGARLAALPATAPAQASPRRGSPHF